MRQLIIIAVLVLTAPLLLSSSCKKTTRNAATDCEGVICTMMFASVSTTVTNKEGTPVVLDEVYTIRKRTGEKIVLSQQQEGGRYTVLDDGYLKQFYKSTETFVLVGMKGQRKVVEEEFVISADCCHVVKQSGKEVIVVE